MPNRLAGETSPYLLQHADNPVDWYPWGDEALERARAEDRPILLSIGYSACHWCHVMERESFEDEVTAAAMNEGFVNVKVDREERPDVDAVYMRAVQALTGHGGWPLTAFLTPDGEPWYGGTYFPPEPRQGMPSFRQVLSAVRGAWDDRRDDVRRSAGEIRAMLERAARPRDGGSGETGAPALDATALVRGAVRAMSGRFDEEHGGFGPAPKFPQPVQLGFLLDAHALHGDREALRMAVATLERMAAGGLRDHLGGGFHRYSVDRRWLVPHFEKMLYDNALLARVYLHAWQRTGREDFRDVAVETLEWLLDDMRAPGGGFYAARDADSESEEGHHEEGAFYVWTPEELEGALGPEDARVAARAWGVVEGGNFEGRSILHLPRPLSATAEALGMRVEELRERLAGARRTLLAERARRPEPLRDEKVLAGWNGMALRTLAEAGGALGRSDWIDAAAEGMDWLLGALRGDDGRLRHVWTAGRAHVPAFLEDVAALGNAALTLHEVTLDPRWLEEGRAMARDVVDRFWVEAQGVFYDTAHPTGAEGPAEALVVRPRETMDNATPSGTSLAVELCLRVAHLFDDRALRETAERAIAGERDLMERAPGGFGRLLAQAAVLDAPPIELAVVGAPGDERTRALLRPMLARHRPGRAVAGRPPGAPAAPDVPLMAGREAATDAEGRPVPTAWLCRGYACDAPTTDPAELEASLAAGGG